MLTTLGFLNLQLQTTISNYVFNIFCSLIGISNAPSQNCTNLCPCKSVLPQSFPFQLIVTPSFHLLPKTPGAIFCSSLSYLSFNPSGNPVFVLPSRYIHLTATTTDRCRTVTSPGGRRRARRWRRATADQPESKDRDVLRSIGRLQQIAQNAGELHTHGYAPQ